MGITKEEKRVRQSIQPPYSSGLSGEIGVLYLSIYLAVLEVNYEHIRYYTLVGVGYLSILYIDMGSMPSIDLLSPDPYPYIQRPKNYGQKNSGGRAHNIKRLNDRPYLVSIIRTECDSHFLKVARYLVSSKPRSSTVRNQKSYLLLYSRVSQIAQRIEHLRSIGLIHGTKVKADYRLAKGVHSW